MCGNLYLKFSLDIFIQNWYLDVPINFLF